MRDTIIDILTSAGACAVGFAPAAPVSPADTEAFDRWIADGHNASMGYMEKWREIRFDPRLLLEDARTVISMAFPYPKSDSLIASYALGEDYHDVMRQTLTEAVKQLREALGGDYRICIDSAPILERYWAEKAGIGRRGRNGLIAIPGYGQRVFLAEIITTLPIDLSARSVLPSPCAPGCDLCRRACPAHALQDDSTVDARRCLSYLTIEHRGDWDRTGAEAMATPAGRRSLFGCEVCINACPLNRLKSQPKHLSQFTPRPEILSLTREQILDMDQTTFSTIFRRSPIKRTKLAGLRRNAENILKSQPLSPAECCRL